MMPEVPLQSPADAAESARVAAGTAIVEAARQAELDSRDIRDPSVKPPVREPEPAGTPAPASTPQTIHGATVAQPGARPAPAGADFPDWLIARAGQFGLTPADAKAYWTPEALERALWEAAQTPEQPKADDELKLPELDKEIADALDPRMVAYWKQQNDLIAAQAKALKETRETLAAMDQRSRADSSSQIRQKLDAGFHALGDEWADTFGTADAPNVTARAQVANCMDGIAQSFSAAGQPVPTLEQLQTMAVRALHGDKEVKRATEQAQTTVQARLRSQSGQFIARPTASAKNDDKPPTDPAARDAWAAKRLSQRMAKAGWGDEAREEHLNGVPA